MNIKQTITALILAFFATIVVAQDSESFAIGNSINAMTITIAAKKPKPEPEEPQPQEETKTDDATLDDKLIA